MNDKIINKVDHLTDKKHKVNLQSFNITIKPTLYITY